MKYIITKALRALAASCVFAVGAAGADAITVVEGADDISRFYDAPTFALEEGTNTISGRYDGFGDFDGFAIEIPAGFVLTDIMYSLVNNSPELREVGFDLVAFDGSSDTRLARQFFVPGETVLAFDIQSPLDAGIYRFSHFEMSLITDADGSLVDSSWTYSIDVAAVPLPPAMAFMIAGFGALAGFRFRRPNRARSRQPARQPLQLSKSRNRIASVGAISCAMALAVLLATPHSTNAGTVTLDFDDLPRNQQILEGDVLFEDGFSLTAVQGDGFGARGSVLSFMNDPRQFLFAGLIFGAEGDILDLKRVNGGRFTISEFQYGSVALAINDQVNLLGLRDGVEVGSILGLTDSNGRFQGPEDIPITQSGQVFGEIDTLRFVIGPQSAGGNGIAFDNFVIETVPVPVPPAAVALLSGLACLWRRRRRPNTSLGNLTPQEFAIRSGLETKAA